MTQSVVVDRQDTNEGVRAKQAKSSFGTDLYDGILWRLRASFEDLSQFKICGFLSSRPAMGVTTVASQVAMRAAEHHFGRVLLVDANLKSNGLSRSFRLRKSPGLADYMNGAVELDATFFETSIDGLTIMPAGISSSRVHLAMKPSSAADLVGELRARFDFIVFDLGHAFNMNSSILIAKELDSTVLVVRSGSLRRADLLQETQAFLDDKINVKATVLTRHRRYMPLWLDRWI